MIHTYTDKDGNIHTDLYDDQDKEIFLIEVGSTIAALFKTIPLNAMDIIIKMARDGEFHIDKESE